MGAQDVRASDPAHAAHRAAHAAHPAAHPARGGERHHPAAHAAAHAARGHSGGAAVDDGARREGACAPRPTKSSKRNDTVSRTAESERV
eukprot:6890920-Pyramimonas_sp.AAC.1